MELVRTQLALFKAIERATDDILDTPQRMWTEGRVSSHLDHLEDYWYRFSKNHGDLLLGDEEVQNSEYFSEDFYTICERSYLEARGHLLDERDRLFRLTQSSTSVSSESVSHARSAKLKPVELPNFSGLQEDWETFRDLFKSLVHSQPNFSDAQKMSYLKTHVQGEAEKALEKLNVSDQNYASAWSILEARYNQYQILIQEHIKALIRIQPLREESAGDLQFLADEISRHRNQLKALNRPVDLWNEWFITLASEAMDPVTRRLWEKEVDDFNGDLVGEKAGFPDFSILERFLQRQCRTLRAIGIKTNNSYSSRPSGNEGVRSNRRPVSTLATTSHHASTCAQCEGSHYIGHCEKFQALGLKERRDLVTKANLCFNCLKSGHVSRDCSSNKSCRECNGQHHTLIHDATGKRRRQQDSKNLPNKFPRFQTFATQTGQKPNEASEEDSS